MAKYLVPVGAKFTIVGAAAMLVDEKGDTLCGCNIEAHAEKLIRGEKLEPYAAVLMGMVALYFAKGQK